MAAETAQKFAALEAQAQVLMSVFGQAGHEAVAPAVIQPADVFLDVIGEALRARTCVFTDPDGAELCLRPDLTVPTCRLHIARSADPAKPAKYCYNGSAFRFQPQGADAAHPREFRQAGIERFGDSAREAAEADTITLMMRAVEAAGLKDWTLRLGDVGLFRAVLEAAHVPPRAQAHLVDAFQKPGAFLPELQRLTTSAADRARALPTALADRVRGRDVQAIEAELAGYLDEAGIEVIGERTIAEMAARVADLTDKGVAAPLDPATARLIRDYAAISGPARNVGETISALLSGARDGPGAALDAFDRRLALIANAGVDLERATFSAEFGRNLAYYTGLVFEIAAPGFDDASPIAGGGRYDGLMRAAGAGADVPAVGAAIHTERLLAAVAGGGA